MKRKPDGLLQNIIRRKRKSGEMLVETIVSLAIFALVMLVVATMTAASFHMLETSDKEYKRIWEQSSEIEAGQYAGQPQAGEDKLYFSFDDKDHTKTQSGIDIYSDGPITFFEAGNAG